MRRSNKKSWVFPVCSYQHRILGNMRAVYEAVKDDFNIRKVILYRSIPVKLPGNNVVSCPLFSLKAIFYLATSSVVFLQHTAWQDIRYPFPFRMLNFVNLWHGIPLKRIGCASLDLKSSWFLTIWKNLSNSAVISSSKVDRLAMHSAMRPVSFNNIWITGLPRHDFVLCKESNLPLDMQNDLERLRGLLGGKRLVLFAPTFRNSKNGYYHFSDVEIQKLKELLKEHNAVLGVREHMASGVFYYRRLADLDVLDLSADQFPNLECLYREVDVLMTDYSSCYIDFLLTYKPVVSFSYDFDNYRKKERGLFYDMPQVFPGEITKTFEGLVLALRSALSSDKDSAHNIAAYDRCIGHFYDFKDLGNALRVVERVKSCFGSG